ncbi:hypothetical protein [Protaetiibacter mangrovi]|uniref:Peptidylprolyl isomerase n=1 Tax=Protaetiibacter mangrovi TaxID=2970926 RepID=A0ABT1ZC76_9MICO|nr:hypothetical protein [Protaetiibacter mangrovi]MCS0498305.1 hypothetical protein [Protaetiibacter mangrovi]TPX03625.1 hypothetical protein FJ656_16165 [Schumannella luteola]
MRRSSALLSSVAVVAVLSATLAGCAASPDDVSACTPLVADGDTAAIVTASGEVGSAPTVEVPAPLVVTAPERTVLEDGTGLVARAGSIVDFDAAIYDGATGSEVLATKFDGSQGPRFRAGLKTADTQETVPSLAASLVCAQAGQRTVLVTTAGDAGIDFSSVGITDEKHTVVLVIDVQRVYPGKSDGVNQLPQDGMPVVVTAPDGTVGVTVPSGIDVPSEDRTETVKLGSGPKLAEGDAAVLQVANWTWPSDGEVTLKSSTWEVGKTPQTITLTKEGDTEQGLPATFFEALEGTPVGSQVLIVIAPTADSSTGDATIYVIDVLGIQSSADDTK